MKFGLKCIGRFKNVEVKLDGITVICGENSTGKSTVGKALFCCFNSMCDFDEKIKESRKSRIHLLFRRNSMRHSHIRGGATVVSSEAPSLRAIYIQAEDYFQILTDMEECYDKQKLTEYLSQIHYIQDVESVAEESINIMKRSDDDILSEHIHRYFSETYIGQIRNINTSSNTISRAAMDFRDGTNSVRFYANKCNLEKMKVIVSHPAYYIDNPFVVNDLNYHTYYNREIDGNVINAIVQARKELAADKMTDIFDAVDNKERLQDVYAVMKKAYKGKTVIIDGQYFYEEKGSKPVNFINLSTGLKSFALIERLLESGKLKTKDVLILDEPEIHLHPEWQLVYAEVIVLLQKALDLTVLITTHSPYFLDAIDKYTLKYDTVKNAAYYLAENEGVHSTLKDVTTDLESIYELMYKPMQKLEKMEYGIYD